MEGVEGRKKRGSDVIIFIISKNKLFLKGILEIHKASECKWDRDIENQIID